MNTLVIGIIIAVGLLTVVILLVIYNEESKQLEYRLTLYQKHDVIVDGNIMTFTNDAKPWVMIKVNEYLKSPKNAEYLTVWGDFDQNSEYCIENESKCDRVLAYIYEDRNGIYHQGETFDWIDYTCDARCHLGFDPTVLKMRK
ncbi:MAG: hypothetical protein WEC35_03490 [Nitrosopumilaceae archaeon]